MANRLMTQEEVRREIEFPLLQAIRRDLLHLLDIGKSGEQRFSGIGDCLGFSVHLPSDPLERAKWKKELQAGLDQDLKPESADVHKCTPEATRCK